MQCANFVGDLIDHCVDAGLERVVLVGHAGKLVKVAAGVWNTHSRVADARLETLAALAAAAGAPPPLVVELLELPTVEAAVTLLADAGLAGVWDDVAERAARRAGERAARRAGSAACPRCDCAVVGYDGAILGRSTALRAGSAAARDAATPAAAAPSRLELTVVGTGPGADEWLTPAAWRHIRAAEVVVGGRRQLERFAPAGAERDRRRRRHGRGRAHDPDLRRPPHRRAGQRRPRLLRHRRVTAPPAAGGGCRRRSPASARRSLPRPAWVAPGPTSSSRAPTGSSWMGVVAAVAAHPRVLALTDARRSPQVIAAALVAAGLRAAVTVLERLGEPDECITSADAASIAAGEFDGLSVVFIEREEPA